MTSPTPQPDSTKRVSGPLVLLGFAGIVLALIVAFWLLSQASRRRAEPGQGLAPGVKLMQQHRCYTCHHDDGQFTGPSLRQLAERYRGADAAQVDTLVAKVREGGQGNWGRSPMIPHPHVREADIRAILDYILAFPTDSTPPAEPPAK